MSQQVKEHIHAGAVKITPAHDLADFQAGQRHSLDMLQVINELGQISEINKELQGMPRFQARDVVIDRLQTMGLFRGSENHKMLLPLCSRSKDVVELLMRPQWFIKCNEMATRALKSVEEEMLSIQPKDFEKNWKNWMGNIRDWCISRQLWWGHQIPAYCCTNENNPQEQIWVAARNDNEAKLKASVKLGVNEDKITCTRDEDVLDTWFSSSLQPFATFGWPNKTEKLTKYYPLSLMETGHDILLFWVARMVMLGVQLTGELPFNEILLHGIICDPQGRKMSKSLGNVVSPDDVIRGVSLELMEKRVNESHKKGLISSVELKRAIRGQKTMFPQGIPECGSDALRFTLLSHNVKNHFIKFEVSECHTNRLFCNKIWQATKFTKIWCKAVSEKQEIQTVETNQFSVTDKWILSRLTKLVDNVNTALDCYDFHVAVASLKDFLYYDFCDVYLETIKRELQSSESSTAATHCWVLTKCLDVGLRCLGPFMPVLSQHLHKSLPILDDTGNSLEFPKALKCRDEQLEKDFEELLRIITSLRRLKKIFNISKKHEPQAYLISNWSFLEQMSDIVSDLSACSSVHVSKNKFDSDILKGCVTDSLGETTIFLTVHEEVMKNLKVDLPNMQKKRMKLVHELDKLMTLASTEKNKLKIHSDAEVTLSKKILVVKEKIARIDCINSFIRN